MSQKTLVHILAAVLIGSLYGWIALKFWASGIESPVFAWLMETLATRGHSSLFALAVSIHDAIINVLLAAPFAVVFVMARPLNHWPFIAVAVLPIFIANVWGANWSSHLLSHRGFWFGLGMALLSLPVAFAAARVIHHSLGRNVDATRRVS